MEQSPDTRRRPVVLQTGGTGTEAGRRSLGRYAAWAGTGLLGLVAAAGLVAGGTAVWSAFDPGTPGESPAPLWFPPTLEPKAVTTTPNPTVGPGDDKGGLRTPTTGPSTEPGDDKGGLRKKDDDDKSGHSGKG
ncbi:hypothetical protein [Kribbella lupini]|uniref:Uncharacterized protein n=1 Tax=Kribbella lupini TaxID=291602 RepID=A0ABP4M0F1_9ACTN